MAWPGVTSMRTVAGRSVIEVWDWLAAVPIVIRIRRRTFLWIEECNIQEPIMDKIVGAWRAQRQTLRDSCRLAPSKPRINALFSRMQLRKLFLQIRHFRQIIECNV